jgi:hypothetical protein
MRKRLMLFWTPVVLGLAIMLPATTAASGGYSYKTVYNYCNGNQVNLKMKSSAAGWTNANSLTIDSWAQRKLSSGWQSVYQWNQAYYNFPINGAKHTLTAWRTYNGNNSYYFRILFQLRAWHNNTLLASSSFKSVVC